MFRVLQERVPNFGDPMWQMLRQRRFGAVVLVDNPDSEEGKDTYSNYHFGDAFMEVLRQNYEPAEAPERNTFLYRARIPPKFTELPPLKAYASKLTGANQQREFYAILGNKNG